MQRFLVLMRYLLVTILLCIPSFLNVTLAEQLKNTDDSLAVVGKVVAGQKVCTAPLIGTNTVLTAAHCLFQTQKRSYISPNRITFYYCVGNKKAIAKSQVKTYTVGIKEIPKGSSTEKFLYDDWAILTLQADLGCQYESMPVKRSLKNKEDTTLFIAGYPASSPRALTKITQCLYALKPQADKVLRLKNSPVEHGDSGAPIIKKNSVGYRIIGLVSAGVNDTKGRYRVIGTPYQAFSKKLKKTLCP
ncbi:MAG TPA: trypsin-like serine protease [Psychromonas hadalis]|nr:trypsin-like serine protease [Psychromonas hadalis]